MQKTFQDYKDQQIVCCVNIFPKREQGHCHIYSHPYTINCYYNVANHFPGGLFPTVRGASLYDELTFEHEFFLRISQWSWRIINRWIFLFDQSYTWWSAWRLYRTSLPNGISLFVACNSLQKVTHNFTRNSTRVNCMKVAHLFLYNDFDMREFLKDYFSLAKISSIVI